MSQFVGSFVKLRYGIILDQAQKIETHNNCTEIGFKGSLKNEISIKDILQSIEGSNF